MFDLTKFNNGSYQRGASRGKELAWWVVRSIFFGTWFPVPSLVKVKLLRLFGAQVGQGVVIRSRVNITMPWRLRIGDHVWIGDEVMILSLDRVRIASHCCISQRAFLCTGSHDFSKESFDLITRDIEIGESCWVGAQAFVGPGVVMRKASRCLAGAVVVKEVMEDQVVGGVPAEALK